MGRVISSFTSNLSLKYHGTRFSLLQLDRITWNGHAALHAFSAQTRMCVMSSLVVRNERQPLLLHLRPPDGGVADVDQHKHHCQCRQCASEPQNDHSRQHPVREPFFFIVVGSHDNSVPSASRLNCAWRKYGSMHVYVINTIPCV